MKLLTKTIILLIIAGIIALIVTQKSIQDTILDFLSRNIPYFPYIMRQVSSGTLIGVLLYATFANIPILPSLPSEAYAIIAYTKGSNILGIIFIITGVYVIFASIYYFIGRLFGLRIIEKITKKQIKPGRLFQNFSGTVLFLLYLFPIPVIGSFASILILFLGAYKAELKKVVAIVALAIFLRFLAILLLYKINMPLIEKYLPIK